MLYLVGTPIGNLKEITQYAIEILNNADYILCEDTRTSSVLLNHYDIKKTLKSYHKFNERESVDAIIKGLFLYSSMQIIETAHLESNMLHVPEGKAIINQKLDASLK